MESLFFNLNDRKYKVSTPQSGIKRVDISQGLLFFDVKTTKDSLFKLDFIDKMLIVFVVKSGKLVLNLKDIVRHSGISMFCYAGGDLEILFKDKSEVFVMFVADFFLKNYLSDEDTIVDKLYQKMQKSLVFEEVYSYKLDSLSSFFVQRVLEIDKKEKIKSLKAESLSLELLLHFLEIGHDRADLKDLELANRAKEVILKSFSDDLSIKKLAKLCDTNQTKLKKVFKEFFGSTIYSYIQELRLKKAYYLLRDEDFTVGEVSRMVGYSHQGNFSKLFKKKYKIEPSLINKSPFLAK